MRASLNQQILSIILCLFVPVAMTTGTELQFPKNPKTTEANNLVTATYKDIATLDGEAIELIAETTSQSPVDANNELKAKNGSMLFVLDGKEQTSRVATVKYTIVRAGTTTPVTLEAVGLRVKLIPGQNEEMCSLETSDAIGFKIPEGSGILVNDSNGISATTRSGEEIYDDYEEGTQQGYEIILDFGTCQSFTINYGCDFLSDNDVTFEHLGAEGNIGTPEPPTETTTPGPGPEPDPGTTEEGNGTAGKPLYYTYKFFNESDVGVPVDLADVLQEGLEWDKAYVPVKEGILVFDVDYKNEREACIPGLLLPSGISKITLSTKPLAKSGSYTSDASITFTDGTKMPPANGNPTVTVESGGETEVTSNPFFDAFNAAGSGAYSVFVTGSRFTLENQASGVIGNAAVADGVEQDLKAGGITGEFHVHVPASGSIGSVDTQPGTGGDPITPIPANLFGTKVLLQMAANTAATTPPTQTLGDVGLAVTLKSTNPDGFNVVQIDNVFMAGYDQINIEGTATDFFLLNIKGSLAFSGYGGVKLRGGIPPSNVVINLMPGATDLKLNSQGTFPASILAVHEDQRIEITSAAQVLGSIAAHEVRIAGGATITGYGGGSE